MPPIAVNAASAAEVSDRQVLGIVGGGQLGRMLMLAAARLGIDTIVLDPDPDAPAGRVTNRHIVAAFDDLEALDQLGRAASAVTYEFENIPEASMAAIAAHSPVHPSSESLRISQDRLTEKQFLNDHGIATAAYRAVDSQAELHTALEHFGNRGIIKTRRFGYDGKGQIAVLDPADLSTASNAYAELGSVPLIVEAVVPFICEISVIAVGGSDGAVVCYAPAHNIHRDGILRGSVVPAPIDGSTRAAALEAAERLIRSLGHVGALGLELFVLPDGSVIANEFAPRVHNSGHWTEAACVVSQFENHVRAVMGLELGQPHRFADVDMINLLGSDADDLSALVMGDPNQPVATIVHRYGKADARPGRKMGHITRMKAMPEPELPDSELSDPERSHSELSYPDGSKMAPAAARGHAALSGSEPSASVELLAEIQLDLPGHRSGKVRESWSLPQQRRVLITTDRLSAFDRVIGLVPHKGQVLNQLAAWWFAQTAGIVPNHVIAVPDPNALIAVDATPLPVEVVVRGRLTGSTDTAILPRYLAGDRVLYGHHLPDGLQPHAALPEPIITPTTKAADGGHDTPITPTEVVSQGLVPAELWAEIERIALGLFSFGVDVAARAGFVLADTKYEFGLSPEGELLIIDEMHTPDSSRYWDAATLEERLAHGLAPDGFDKEPVRLALAALGYRGDGPPPTLDDTVWYETSTRYVTLFERVTGQPFIPGEQPVHLRIMHNLSEFIGP